jgi:hypothetical protein
MIKIKIKVLKRHKDLKKKFNQLRLVIFPIFVNDVETNQNSPKPTSNVKSLLTWSWSLQPSQYGTHAL